MRTSPSITQSERNAWIAFCKQHNIVDEDNEVGINNGNVLGNLIIEAWQADITPATLSQAFAQVKDQLVYYSPAQQQWNQASATLSQTDRDQIISYVSRSQSLKSDGDNVFVNATAFAKWITAHRIPVQNLDSMLPQIVQSPYPIVKKRQLQDSEREAQVQREAASQQPARQDQRAEATGQNTLAPHLQAHREMVHRAMAEAEERKMKEANPTVDQQAWKARAESLVADSHLDNAQIKKMFVFVEHTTDIDWPATHRARLNHIERRRNSRGLAGR